MADEWRTAYAITRLFEQADAAAPHRSKESDGTIADDRHGPESKHQPHYVPGVGHAIVTAGDFTHDPAGGWDARKMCEDIRVSRDPRVRLVISHRQQFSSYSTSTRDPWQWGDYTGDDPHTNHAHVEVLDTPICDDTRDWAVSQGEKEDTKMMFPAYDKPTDTLWICDGMTRRTITDAQLTDMRYLSKVGAIGTVFDGTGAGTSVYTQAEAVALKRPVLAGVWKNVNDSMGTAAGSLTDEQIEAISAAVVAKLPGTDPAVIRSALRAELDSTRLSPLG